MPNYPTSLDALANPTSTTLRNDPGFSLAGQVSALNDIAEALEAKVGIGASVAAAGTVLRGTGAGASAYGALVSADIQLGQVPVRLATTGVLAAPLASAVFNGISQAFGSLEVRIFGRSSAAVIFEAMRGTINGTVTASYFNQGHYASGATPGAVEILSATFADLGVVPGASASPAGWMGQATAWLHGYSGTTTMKTVQSLSYVGFGTPTANQYVQSKGATLTGSFAPVTSVAVFPSTGQWAAGSLISLYGWP